MLFQVTIRLDEELVKGKKQSQWYKLQGVDPTDQNDYGEIEVELLWKDNYNTLQSARVAQAVRSVTRRGSRSKPTTDIQSLLAEHSNKNMLGDSP